MSEKDEAPPGGHSPARHEPGVATRVGLKRRPRDDLYHFLLQATWRRVLIAVAAVYAGLNTIFACLYLASPDCIAGARPGSFSDAFFFSVQTFSTIGYGTMAPKTTYGSAVVTLEAFVGLVTVAMATGLMFAKFSRPTSRVLFSKQMVITQRNGLPTLMFRAANERGNDVVEASFRLTALMPETTLEGTRMRRLFDLPLVRQDTPLFTLTFVGMHVVDETSPLRGMTIEALAADQVRFIVTVTGLDGTFASTIQARQIYFANNIEVGARFVDVLSNGPGGELVLDYRMFHDTIPTEIPPEAPPLGSSRT
jgi:inward rectifier potassium channel